MAENFETQEGKEMGRKETEQLKRKSRIARQEELKRV
jgi:hypothetical protein